MNCIDVEIVRNRYSERYKQYGYSPKTLGWGENGRQSIRFSILTKIGDLNNKSILDVGCGFGDLYGYLLSTGWSGTYTGIDIVQELITEGKQRFPDANLLMVDFDDYYQEKKVDYIIASGIFNFKLSCELNMTYIQRTLKKMFDCAVLGVSVDFMTTWVDYQTHLAFHTNPSQIINIIRKITNQFVIRQDYMPYEYSLYLYPARKLS
jgi:trans-aconitate methyltransferase